MGPFRTVLHDLGEVGSADDVREVAIAVRDQLGSDAGVAVVAGAAGGRAMLVVATNEAARAAGAKAGVLAKLAAGILGGGGGGRDDVAQGGGTDVAALPKAFDGIEQELRRA